MKYIQLTQGKRAIVDDKDFEWLNKIKWYYNARGYAGHTKYLGGGRKNQKSKIIWMHRLIINTPSKLFTDHINGNGLDNRRKNLRIATFSQNSINRLKNHGISKYKGVGIVKKKYKNKIYKYWDARIKQNGKRIYLGNFDNEHDAALMYDLWAYDLFGEFAKTNFKKVIC